MNNGMHLRKVDAKIVIIGNSDVGKSALMERFVYLRFRSKREATIGTTYVSKQVTRGKKSIVLAIWDTAGTERYRAMMKNYYRNAKAAIICYDVTNRYSWDVLRSWVSEIRNNEENCRLYICGTKKDLVDDGYAPRDVPSGTVQFYAEGLGAPIIDTSSKTGENVEELFLRIADDLLNAVNDEKRASTVILSPIKKRTCCR